LKISRLELEDYKCFEHLVLEQLGNRVVLVGPNGCGKSAILEAIAIMKEYIGTYNPNVNIYHTHIPLLNKHTTAWKSGVPLPIRADGSSATIKVHLTLNESEQALVDGLTDLEAAVRIDRSREVVCWTSNPKLGDLFRHYDPASGIGVFDYISPDRQYQSMRVTALNMSCLSLDAQRMERIELLGPGNTSQKFAAIKHFIISEQLNDLSVFNATGERQNSIDMLQQLFEFFFSPKKLIGGVTKDDEFQVLVKTPYGSHDLDQLSSGEKELFTIFVNLFRIRNFPAVILYDEPERHLNPGLEAKLIPALDKLQTQNQLWISTHGTELIGAVPIGEVVALRREAGRSHPERFLDDTKTSRVRLFEQIGARVGLQLASNRVVFLEGKEAYADKRILDYLAGPCLPGVLFVASGSSLEVQGAATRAGLLIEHASMDAAFMMVLDRDYRDDKSIKELQRKLNNRAFVWNCHELENLLLDPDIILDVLKFNGCTEFGDASAVKEGLLSAAKEMAERFAVEWATYNLHSTFNIQSTGSPQTSDKYFELANTRRDRLETAFATDRVERELTEAKERVEHSFYDGTWSQLLPGKEILRSFRKKHLVKLPNDFFIEHIVSFMVEKKFQPPEIERLFKFIKGL